MNAAIYKAILRYQLCMKERSTSKTIPMAPYPAHQQGFTIVFFKICEVRFRQRKRFFERSHFLITATIAYDAGPKVKLPNLR